MEDSWTPELVAARDLMLAKCRRSNRAFGALGLAAFCGSAVLMMRGGHAGAAALAFSFGLLAGVGLTVLSARWVPTPRQCRWLWILAIPVGLLIGHFIAPIAIERGLVGVQWAGLMGFIGGSLIAAPFAIRRFYSDPRHVHRMLELGWDPAHPYRSFLRRR